MASAPQYPLWRHVIDAIQRDGVADGMAWETVGNLKFTDIWAEHKPADLVILPSQMFIPRHFSEPEGYEGAGIICKQHWGSTLGAYGSSNL
jgi:hypothetical protein